MIAQLQGELAAKSSASAIIDVGGIGFAVGMSQSCLAKLPEVGHRVKVFTHLQVREDGLSLYGFSSLKEKALFEKLIGISGIGPKAALAALSVFTPEALIEAITQEDASALSRIPGVGKKTASRIILELKGSLSASDAPQLFSGGQSAPANTSFACAREALLSMGFSDLEANLALQGGSSQGSESELIHYALKKLGARQ